MQFYKASAFGFGGILCRPYSQTIDTHGSVVLSPTGGHGQQSLQKIQIGSILSAELVECDVLGSYDEIRNAYSCVATVAISGLNVLNILTADRIVARVSSLYSGTADEEPAITVIGSHFDNLRIAGHALTATLSTDVFQQHNTFSKIERAYKSGNLSEYIPGSKLPDVSPDDHPSLYELHRQYLSRTQHLGEPRWLSLIQGVQGLGPDIRSYGSVIDVPDFGLIHLAEILIDRQSRRVNMVRLQLGSPVEGQLAFATVEAGTTDVEEGRPPKGRPTKRP